MHSQFTLWSVMLQCVLLLVCALLVQPGAGTGVCKDKIRLQQGQKTEESAYGRVEYCAQYFWRSVCNKTWGVEEARVVCRELGFGGAVPLKQFAIGTGNKNQILFDCNGEEDRLANCTKLNKTVELEDGECNGEHDSAGVFCYNVCQGKIRLQQGKKTEESAYGRVEYCALHTWRSVCNKTWGVEEARVVCRELGFEVAVPLKQFAIGTGNRSDIKLFDCNGEEDRLTNCTKLIKTAEAEDGECNGERNDSAGVFCYNDVDECVEDSHTCHQNAFCTDTPGSYICTCNAGYTGNGTHCEDIDECGDCTQSCSSIANCINTEGHYYCECQHGYSRRNGSCQRESITDQSDSSPLPAGSSSLPAGSSPLPADTSPLPAGSSPLPAVSSPLPAGSSPLPAISSPLPAGSSPLPAGSCHLSVVSAVLFAVSAVFMMVAIVAVVVAMAMMMRRKKQEPESDSSRPGVSEGQLYEMTQHPPANEHGALYGIDTNPLYIPTAVNNPLYHSSSADTPRQDGANNQSSTVMLRVGEDSSADDYAEVL